MNFLKYCKEFYCWELKKSLQMVRPNEKLGWDPIYLLNAATCLYLTKTAPGFTSVNVVVFLYVMI